MKDIRHNYEYEINTFSGTAPAHVVRMVGQNKRVLEIGCGPGSITRVLSQQASCQVTGLELDPEAIAKVSPYCEQVIEVDLNTSEWPGLFEDKEKFDVVVAADVLEHLYDPWTTLKRMVPLINSDGYLVISLPNISHAAVMACLINGDFEYQDYGLLDRTHIRFFALDNIEGLFSQAGLKIIEANYVIKPPEETELAASWSRLPSKLKDALMSNNHSTVYQVIVKAVPFSYAGEEVTLSPSEYTYPGMFTRTGSSWKVRVGKCLSPQFKQHIRKALGLLGIKL